MATSVVLLAVSAPVTTRSAFYYFYGAAALACFISSLTIQDRRVLYGSHDLLAGDLLLRPLKTDGYWYDAQRQPVLNGYPLPR